MKKNKQFFILKRLKNLSFVAQTFMAVRFNTPFTDNNVCATERYYFWKCNNLFFTFVLFLFCASSLLAQSPTPQDSSLQSLFSTEAPRTVGSQTRFGVYSYLLYNSHNADFNRIDPIPSCCPGVYGLQSSLNLAIGALGEYPLLLERGFTLGLSGRLGLHFDGTRLNRDTILVVGGQNVQKSFPITATLNKAIFEPSVFVRLLDNRLTIYGGGGISTYIAPSMSFDHILPSEFIEVDANGVPANFLYNGVLPNASGVRFAAQGGLSYEFPLNAHGTHLLALEAWYQHTFSAITPSTLRFDGSAGSWTLGSVRVGVSYRLAPERTTPQTPEEIAQRADSIVRERNARLAKLQREKEYRDSLLKEAVVAKIVSVKAVLPDGTLQDSVLVRVKEFRTAVSHYLLPTVFFGEQSSVIPQQYLRVSANNVNLFSINNLKTLADIDLYRNILGIVGRRMRENPRASLRIVAYSDAFSENNNERLAEDRARAVERYFEKVWGIGADRLSLQTSSHAPLAGMSKNASLNAQEQRRVDLFSTSPEILDEITFETVQREVSPSKLAIQCDMYAGAGLKQWLIEASQFNEREDKVLWQEQGFTPEQKRTFVWNLEKTNVDSLPESNEVINFRLSIADQIGKPDESKLYSVPAELKRIGAGGEDAERIETFTIFPFNYGTSLPADDAALQRKIANIKKSLEPASVVDVIGFTDTRGDEANNQTLSEERARYVASILNHSTMNVKGGGESSRYDNGSPEGRFYNRFVKVIVRTPAGR
jgi:outer membrane protein OmpA-like peptidoglycan-associated protein